MSRNKTMLRGSLTVEAALVVPFFLFVLINLISVIEMIGMDIRLEAALHEIGREMANYSYVYSLVKSMAEESENESEEEMLKKDEEIKKEGDFLIRKAESIILAEAYAGTRIIEIIGEDYLNRSMIVGGSSGIQFWRSSVLEEDNIDLIMSYRVKPWFGIPGIGSMQFVKRCCVKGFTGYVQSGSKPKSENVYYITTDSEVYHCFRECTHLQLSIMRTDFERLDNCRNMEGSRYKACEYCIGESESYDYVYIALQGEKYHSTLACKGLKRTIYVITDNQTVGRRRCQRCG